MDELSGIVRGLAAAAAMGMAGLGVLSGALVLRPTPAVSTDTSLQRGSSFARSRQRSPAPSPDETSGHVVVAPLPKLATTIWLSVWTMLAFALWPPRGGVAAEAPAELLLTVFGLPAYLLPGIAMAIAVKVVATAGNATQIIDLASVPKNSEREESTRVGLFRRCWNLVYAHDTGLLTGGAGRTVRSFRRRAGIVLGARATAVGAIVALAIGLFHALRLAPPPSAPTEQLQGSGGMVGAIVAGPLSVAIGWWATTVVFGALLLYVGFVFIERWSRLRGGTAVAVALLPVLFGAAPAAAMWDHGFEHWVSIDGDRVAVLFGFAPDRARVVDTVLPLVEVPQPYVEGTASPCRTGGWWERSE